MVHSEVIVSKIFDATLKTEMPNSDSEKLIEHSSTQLQFRMVESSSNSETGGIIKSLYHWMFCMKQIKRS
jgi:hypothetical protein